MSVKKSLELLSKELRAKGEILVGTGKKEEVCVRISEVGVGFPFPSWCVNVSVDYSAKTTKSFWRYKSALKHFQKIVETYALKVI